MFFDQRFHRRSFLILFSIFFYRRVKEKRCVLVLRHLHGFARLVDGFLIELRPKAFFFAFNFRRQFRFSLSLQLFRYHLLEAFLRFGLRFFMPALIGCFIAFPKELFPARFRKVAISLVLRCVFNLFVRGDHPIHDPLHFHRRPAAIRRKCLVD